MKIHSYTGPYTDTTADCPTIDINVDTGREEGGLDRIHYGAIQIHGDEMIAKALALLLFMGVPLS